MKNPLLILLTTVITTSAGITSLSLASLENPTDLQRQISNTSNAIALAGTTAIFGLLKGEA
ncbi:hypothetical protein [Lyngbya confervoides]|uniref:Uncharacterized protein n=1 Tax=Lyngbya confervoides BDU141951 TaxID=1574623 RepID=A0ABD4SZ33_9CYAN|nr:hypothetical protein [Lyngbya confervoides]MCM1981726.1 hypothetical protein [Lyngbya confervoides BDU141951]